jgi:hypothetical protein
VKASRGLTGRRRVLDPPKLHLVRRDDPGTTMDCTPGGVTSTAGELRRYVVEPGLRDREWVKAEGLRDRGPFVTP